MSGGIAGTWNLTLNSNIVSLLNAAGLFQRSSFDHRAFELKAGSNWAVYAFDFNAIGGFDLTKSYLMSGTFNLNDFRNSQNTSDQGIAQLTLWARDPVQAPTTNIPEPGMLGLLGIGLLSLAGLRPASSGNTCAARLKHKPPAGWLFCFCRNFLQFHMAHIIDAGAGWCAPPPSSHLRVAVFPPGLLLSRKGSF